MFRRHRGGHTWVPGNVGPSGPDAVRSPMKGARPRPTARCGQVAGGAGCWGCSGGIAPLQPPGGGGAGKVLLPLSPTQS
jgi:hypothetical protein